MMGEICPYCGSPTEDVGNGERYCEKCKHVLMNTNSQDISTRLDEIEKKIDMLLEMFWKKKP